jgi:hypothetical protein
MTKITTTGILPPASPFGTPRTPPVADRPPSPPPLLVIQQQGGPRDRGVALEDTSLVRNRPVRSPSVRVPDFAAVAADLNRLFLADGGSNAAPGIIGRIDVLAAAWPPRGGAYPPGPRFGRQPCLSVRGGGGRHDSVRPRERLERLRVRAPLFGAPIGSEPRRLGRGPFIPFLPLPEGRDLVARGYQVSPKMSPYRALSE